MVKLRQHYIFIFYTALFFLPLLSATCSGSERNGVADDIIETRRCHEFLLSGVTILSYVGDRPSLRALAFAGSCAEQWRTAAPLRSLEKRAVKACQGDYINVIENMRYVSLMAEGACLGLQCFASYSESPALWWGATFLMGASLSFRNLMTPTLESDAFEDRFFE